MNVDILWPNMPLQLEDCENVETVNLLIFPKVFVQILQSIICF